MAKNSLNSYIYFLVNVALISSNFETRAHFTRFPPNVLYVTSGGTARFVWDYHVNNRDNEFTGYSPSWYFINQTTVLADSKIGYDYLYKPGDKWGFVISRATCPPRLLKPDRVSREPKATLVITNVTTDDNGIYQCVLDFVAGNPEKNQSQLIVTVPPKFLPSHPNNTYQVIEGHDLKLNCTAIGPPTPNITWVNVTEGNDSAKSQGSGSAILNIDNIQRYHGGVYECRAKNNPNDIASTTRTRVTVYYAPDIKKEATPNAESCIGRPTQLVCKANGMPKPLMILKDSSGNELKRNYSSGEIFHFINIKKSSQFGNFTCIAQNFLGNATHVISLKEKSCPNQPPNTGSGSKVPAGIIAGVVIAGILAIAGLVIALIFCYRRKTLDSRRSSVAQERTVQMSSLQEEHYASVQHQQDDQIPSTEPIPQYAKVNKKKKKGAAAEELPQYAQVDKSKKKGHNPDELVYADLALDSKDENEPIPTSSRHPTNESNTVYADIAGNRQQNLEAQYGNLQERDVMI